VLETSSLTPAVHRRVWGLSFAHFITDLYSPVLPAVIPLLILSSGYSYLLAGLLVTVYNLTSSMTQPVIGWAFDRSGRVISVSASLMISAVFIALIGLVTDYPLLMLCAILAALGHATFHPAALARVGAFCSDQNRGRLMSYFVIGGNMGFAVSPLLVGVAVGWFGVQGLVLFLLPGTLVALGIWYLTPRDPTPRPCPESDQIRETRNPSAIGGITLLVLGAALRSWMIFASIAYIPTFLIHRGFDLVTANTVATLMLLAGVAGQVVGGTLSDRYGRKEYSIIGMLLAIPPFLLFMASDGIISVIALLLFGSTLWSTFAVTVAMGQEMMPGNIGLASGLVLGLAVGGGGIGVAITGALADSSSLSAALSTLPLPLIGAIGCFVLLPYPWKVLHPRGKAVTP